MLYQLSSRVLWKQKYSDSGMIHLAWEKVFDEFEKINQLSKVNNFKFFTIYIPQNGPWDEEARIPEKLISKNAAEKNYGFISTLDSFINESKTNPMLYYPKDGHCTPAGYSVIAKSIFNFIEKNKLAP